MSDDHRTIENHLANIYSMLDDILFALARTAPHGTETIERRLQSVESWVSAVRETAVNLLRQKDLL